MGLDGENDIALSMVSDNTAKITSAVNSLPQLLEKKRLIDMHTSVATSKSFYFSCWLWICIPLLFYKKNISIYFYVNC